MAKRGQKGLLIVIAVSVVPVLFFNVMNQLVGPEPCPPGVPFWGKTLVDILFSFSVTFTIFQSMHLIIQQMDRRFPWSKKKVVAKRIAIEFLLLSITASAVITGIAFLFAAVVPWIDMSVAQDPVNIFVNIITAVIITTVCVSVWEAVHFFKQWKELAIKAEVLEKEKLQSQFESLRNQVNPHFLFNSLNTLSSLVHTDPDKAERFIDRFAEVYRYVLETKDQNVIPLSEEVRFLKAYLYLLQIRFEKGLDIKLSLSEAQDHLWLPPLALQELIGNAVKHNIVSATRPLTISVQIEGSLLVVRNNLQLRADRPASTGTGQSNLQKRYALFDGASPLFEATEDHYVACLPLIREEAESLSEL